MTDTPIEPKKKHAGGRPQVVLNKELADQQVEAVLGKPKKKHAGGRPTVITADVEVKLVAALQQGMTDQIACQYAGISRDAFYNRVGRDEKFSAKMVSARNFLKLLAAKRVTGILDKGVDRDAGPMARWALERLVPEQFAPKPEVVINNIGYEPPDWFKPVRTVEGEMSESKQKKQLPTASHKASSQQPAATAAQA